MYKILLVDSMIHSRERTQNMLDWSHLGFIIQAYADNSSDALALLNREPLSLVLINIKNTQADGMLLCEHIREQSRVPIILLEGSDDFQQVRKALAYQVSDYIAQPVLASDLTASLLAVKKELDSFSDDPPLAASAPLPFKRKPHAASIIDVVKKYVEEELHLNITLKKISALLHFNCAYLGQKFKDHENMSFNEYLLQQRMEKAKLLLEKTDMRIYEIANEVGYTEIDWFYKKFKAYTGASANEYRKQIS
ncbi:DNA-binding response regulator [Paenibacillus sp. BIHB 4019]|uniref:DNA-binding response regulator n=1 Tax=Paenibacillus sp. BIHB 4019 TaxID=1870819 RepID=A0A1B2DLS2_9BACL|nr:helix-turn-helix domain-containing protein [Paenibacillus sp. BIHB 4019]ANY68656.1 DNA-binding response regulator [Paenibacillus sp. BIHB 4019]